jgi:trimethylamine--corrinoid protein Co-methyltransferase
MARYRTAFYHSDLSSRLSYDAWVEQGRLDTAQRANQKWKDLIDRYEPPPMDPGVVEALKAYKTRRREILLK